MSEAELTAAQGAIEELVRWADSSGQPLGRDQAERLLIYLETLLLWNRSIALVSRQDVRAIAAKHFADCWVAAAEARASSQIVDLGSGAGFPGLVIAIANPSSRVTLIESVGKKVIFLREVIRRAGIDNALVLEQRAESAGRDPSHRSRYDLATSRALGSLTQFLTLARPLLHAAGIAMAMKGPSSGSELESIRPAALGYTFEAERTYVLPDLARRTLLLFRRA